MSLDQRAAAGVSVALNIIETVWDDSKSVPLVDPPNRDTGRHRLGCGSSANMSAVLRRDHRNACSTPQPVPTERCAFAFRPPSSHSPVTSSRRSQRADRT